MRSFQIVTPDDSKPFTIGRKSENSLVLDNLMVSRQHAVMECVSGKWLLRNLTKNSVTQLNGEDVPYSEESDSSQRLAVEDGDIILIGTQQIRASFKDGRLTLLLVNSTASTETGLPDGVTAQLDKDGATLRFNEKYISPEGKSVCQKKLEDGESIRMPGYEISCSAGNVSCRETAVGFDVHAQNLDVYAGKKRLLQDVNFDLPAGEILAIIGRSGQGKSTLLKLLQGINRSGENSRVYIGGLDYRNTEIRKRIAFLEQDPQLRMDLTVRETLLDGGRVSMNKLDFRQNVQGRLEKFCELFGLSQRMDNGVRTLSGGELRRVALARELMGSPGLIILDEPLSGLDPYNSRILCSHLKQLAFLGHTVILTTHSYEALKVANKLLIIHQGREVFYGTPADAYSHFQTEDAEEILSSLKDEQSIDREENFSRQTRAGLVPYIPSNNLYFPKTHLAPVFLYKVGLTAKQWLRDKGKALAILLQPIVIGFLFSQIFSSLSSLWIVAFAVILSANWLALSLSIREIVAEKEILMGEFRKGVKVLPTITAKMFLPVVTAWLQTLIVFAFVNFRVSVHWQPMILVAFLAMVLPAVSIGLTVSAFSKNSGQANALLPLLIIPQVALAGALVPLDQMLPVGRALSTVIWSRYNQSSLLNLFLEREDPLINTIAALAIAIGCYIVMVIKLYTSKKAK